MISTASLRFRLPVLALSVALLGLTASCDRKKDVTPDTEELRATSEDQATGDGDDAIVFDFIEADTVADASRAITSSSPAALRRSNASPCASRTWDPATRTLTIDFGPTNCLCIDGRTRRGQLTAVFSGPRFGAPNSSVTITRQGYFVNDNEHLGTKVVTFTTHNVWNAVVTNGEIRFADGRTATRTANHTVSRTALPGQPTTFSITGTASGVNRRGNAYTATIDPTDPLLKRRDFDATCAGRHVFVDGKITIFNATRDLLALLDYDPIGGAPCDKIASISVNGGPARQFTLR